MKGKAKKKKDFEQQYCLMGLCIHNSFPLTIPYRGVERKLTFYLRQYQLHHFMTDIKQTGYRPQSCYQKYLIF